MLFRAFVRAIVLLIVRRWWGRTSAFSSEARDSISERGMPSSSSTSSGVDTSASSPPRLLSLPLSSSAIHEASIYGLINIKYFRSYRCSTYSYSFCCFTPITFPAVTLSVRHRCRGIGPCLNIFLLLQIRSSGSGTFLLGSLLLLFLLLLYFVVATLVGVERCK